MSYNFFAPHGGIEATRGSHIAFFDLAAGTFATVHGEQAPAARMLAERARAYEHDKPARPAEGTLREILEAYRRAPVRNGTGLNQLRGITRTGRYQAAAERLGPR